MTVRAVSNNPVSPFYNANALNLTGAVGSLTAILDAVLVNGFTGFTALGWTIGQTTTNKRQYIMAAGGTGNSLWVDDSAAGSGGAKEGRCTGYATMSATTPTGTGQFPTSGQSPIGTGMLIIRKSATADSTVRYWTIVGDGHTFYLFTETGDYTAPVGCLVFMFGDFFSYASADTMNCMIIGRTVENGATFFNTNGGAMLDGAVQLNVPSSTLLSNTLVGHYSAGNFTGLGGSLAFGKHSDQIKMGYDNSGTAMWCGYLGRRVANGGNTTWTTEFVYPNPPDTGLYSAPIWIHHGGFVRGYLKGLWCPLQHLPLNHNETFSGTGNLSGKSFLTIGAATVLNDNNSGAAANGFASELFVETSDTWN